MKTQINGCANAYAVSTNRAQKLVVRILTGATDWRFRVSKIKPQLPVPPRYKKLAANIFTPIQVFGQPH